MSAISRPFAISCIPRCGSLRHPRSGHFFSLAAEGHRGHNGIVIKLALRLYVLNGHRLYFDMVGRRLRGPIPSSLGMPLSRARLLHEVALTDRKSTRLNSSHT